MTECNQETFEFTAHFSRRVEAGFSAGRVPERQKHISERTATDFSLDSASLNELLIELLSEAGAVHLDAVDDWGTRIFLDNECSPCQGSGVGL